MNKQHEEKRKQEEEVRVCWTVLFYFVATCVVMSLRLVFFSLKSLLYELYCSIYSRSSVNFRAHTVLFSTMQCPLLIHSAQLTAQIWSGGIEMIEFIYFYRRRDCGRTWSSSLRKPTSTSQHIVALQYTCTGSIYSSTPVPVLQ